jgi:hypothetical protein
MERRVERCEGVRGRGGVLIAGRESGECSGAVVSPNGRARADVRRMLSG